MITLSTNLGNIIKRGQWQPVYVVKLVGTSKTTYTDKSFFVSTLSGSITDSSEYQLYPILESIPSIIESIDIFNATSSVGGFTLNLIGNELTNSVISKFNDYNFYNRDVSVYLGDTTLINLSDFAELYTGVLGKPSQIGNGLQFEVSNSTFKVQKELPDTKLTNSIFSGAENGISADNDGKPNPIIYGGEPFYYGYDGQSTTFSMVKSQRNRMSLCFDVGASIYGSRTYQIADHELNTSDAQYYRVWMKDKRTGRLVKLDSSDYTIYSLSTGSFITIAGVPECYDYWYPDGNYTLIENPSGLLGWQNPEKSCDGNYSTYSQSDLSDSSNTGDYEKIQIHFPEYDIEDSSISEIKFKYVGLSSYNPTYFKVEMYGVFGTAHSTLSGGIKQVRSITDSLATRDRVGQAVEVNNECISAPMGSGSSSGIFYYCFREIKYRPEEIGEIYISCKGKEANATLAGKFTDLSTGDLLENPAHIIGDIVVNKLGITDIDSSFQDSATVLTSWDYSFTLNEFIDSYELLQKLSKDCKSIVRWNSNNKPSIITIKDSYTTNKIINWNEFLSIPLIYKSDLDHVINKLSYNYYKLSYNYYKFDSNYQSVIDREDDRSNIGSQDIYNYISNTSINTDYIANATTAEYGADYYCKNDADSFWSNLHNVVEFDVDIRGSHSYESGSYQPMITLEIGDIVEFEEMVINCMGENWAGKQFMVISKQLNSNKLNIKVFEV